MWPPKRLDKTRVSGGMLQGRKDMGWEELFQENPEYCQKRQTSG